MSDRPKPLTSALDLLLDTVRHTLVDAGDYSANKFAAAFEELAELREKLEHYEQAVTLVGCRGCDRRAQLRHYGDTLTCARCLEAEIERLRGVMRNPPMHLLGGGGKMVDEAELAKAAESKGE